MVNSNIQPQQIGREAAVAMEKTGWWREKTHREIAHFQLFTAELCCPFEVFHEAVEQSLGRSVWIHEFAAGDHLRMEFLGAEEPPTMAEIIALIPAETRVVVGLGKPNP